MRDAFMAEIELAAHIVITLELYRDYKIVEGENCVARPSPALTAVQILTVYLVMLLMFDSFPPPNDSPIPPIFNPVGMICLLTMVTPVSQTCVSIHYTSITNTITNTKNNSNTTKRNFQTTTGRGELELRKLLSPIGRRYLHQINGLLHDSG